VPGNGGPGKRGLLGLRWHRGLTAAISTEPFSRILSGSAFWNGAAKGTIDGNEGSGTMRRRERLGEALTKSAGIQDPPHRSVPPARQVYRSEGELM
jgi:hypothetical protein